MSQCSKRINIIKNELDKISGLDDEVVYCSLLSINYLVSLAVNDLLKYSDENKLNGTCFK